MIKTKIKNNFFKFSDKNSFQRSVKGLIFFTLVVTCIIAAVMFYNGIRIQKEASYSLIRKNIRQVDTEFVSLFRPVVNGLTVARGWGQSGVVNPLEIESLNATFLPVFETQPLIYSVTVSDGGDLAYVLQRKGNEVEIYYRKNGGKPEYTVINESSRENGTDGQLLPDFKFQTAPWVKEAIKPEYREDIYWSEVHTCYAGRSDIVTGATNWKNKADGKTYVIGFSLETENISKPFETFTIGRDTQIFIIAADGNRMDYAQIGRDADSSENPTRAFLFSRNMNNSVIAQALSTWMAEGSSIDSPFKFTRAGTDWWGGINHLSETKGSVLLGVCVPESDLLDLVRDGRYFLTFLIFGIFIIGSLLASVLLLIYYRHLLHDKRFSTTEGKSEKELLELIENGESEGLEFKSSLRWDYREEDVNKRLEEVILKSIAAFNNGEGGVLLIGVNDDGEILGLEKDYGSLKEYGKDYFELHLRNMVSSAYSVEYCATNLQISFHTVKGREVCSVGIAKGAKPLYLTSAGKSGKKTEKFYLRSGNSSRELAKLSEILEYVKNRFQ